MTRNVRLLLIDPQNDFCDLPAPARPALPVPGAHADMQRVEGVIDELGPRIERIAITLDSHHRIDVAHPPFWRTGDGGAVAPFTEIRARAVREGAFVPYDATLRERALAYLDALERRGRYTLMVWPIHCEIGTWGHNVHEAVLRAGHAWEERHGQNIDFFFKGQNPWTEHYSAALAEVPLEEDPGTQLNRALLDWVEEAELLLVAGEASSHCVRATVEHLLEHLPLRTRDGYGRILLLTDCMSAVPGFETQTRDFLDAAGRRGVRLGTSREAAALLE